MLRKSLRAHKLSKGWPPPIPARFEDAYAVGSFVSASRVTTPSAATAPVPVTATPITSVGETAVAGMAAAGDTAEAAVTEEGTNSAELPMLLQAVSDLRDRIEADERFFDSAIVSHGFTEYLRDYDVVIDVPAALPADVPIGDTTGSYIQGRYRYRFTHCPEVRVVTTVRDDVWRLSWDDTFTDYERWEAAGNPEGFVWGVNWADAYPGMSYLSDSTLAASWTERLAREMHEIAIETNTFNLQLVCHDLRVHQLAIGDPWTRQLTPLDAA